jgi:hypothetical protein
MHFVHLISVIGVFGQTSVELENLLLSTPNNPRCSGPSLLDHELSDTRVLPYHHNHNNERYSKKIRNLYTIVK